MPKRLEMEKKKQDYLSLLPTNTEILPETYPVRMKTEYLNYRAMADKESIALILNFMDIKEMLLINGNLNDDISMKKSFKNKSVYSFHQNSNAYKQKVYEMDIRADIVNSDKLETFNFRK